MCEVLSLIKFINNIIILCSIKIKKTYFDYLPNENE